MNKTLFGSLALALVVTLGSAQAAPSTEASPEEALRRARNQRVLAAQKRRFGLKRPVQAVSHPALSMKVSEGLASLHAAITGWKDSGEATDRRPHARAQRHIDFALTAFESFLSQHQDLPQAARVHLEEALVSARISLEEPSPYWIHRTHRTFKTLVPPVVALLEDPSSILDADEMGIGYSE